MPARSPDGANGRANAYSVTLRACDPKSYERGICPVRAMARSEECLRVGRVWSYGLGQKPVSGENVVGEGKPAQHCEHFFATPNRELPQAPLRKRALIHSPGALRL